MSGGRFNYQDRELCDILETLREDIRDIDNREHEDDTKKFLEITYDVTLLSMTMLHRADWYLSCDDGDKEMIKRFFEDLYVCRSLFYTPSLPDLVDDIGKFHNDLQEGKKNE